MSNYTPGPWVVTPASDEGSVRIEASGNPLMVRGRSNRAKFHRTLLAEAPAMAEALQYLMANRGRCFIPNDDGEWDQTVRAILARINGATS